MAVHVKWIKIVTKAKTTWYAVQVHVLINHVPVHLLVLMERNAEAVQSVLTTAATVLQEPALHHPQQGCAYLKVVDYEQI